MEFFGTLYNILRERPDLFINAVLLAYGLTQRSERLASEKRNWALQDKMLEQSSETNDMLGQFKVLLEVLTRGRR